LLSLSPLFTVKKLKITIGGQSTEFSNVGTLAAQFQWSPNTDVKFAFETTSPLPEQSFSGTWSLLKMVDKMGVPSHNGMKFFLVFINNEAKAIFELTPDSRTNPFSRNIKFTLPANL
jgi:type VI protein secretion system component VasK